MDVHRRLADCLVGDVVAIEGRARKIEIIRHGILPGAPMVYVTFEDSLIYTEEDVEHAARWGRRVTAGAKRVERFDVDQRFRVLHAEGYSAPAVG